MSETITFGKYRLIAELGHGGMADVFLAVNEGVAGFSKLQVIKRLRENLAYDAEFVAMLIDEARIAARLNHPNIVQTNEVGDSNGHYYIAMEYLDGQPLHRVLHRASKAGGMPLDLLCITLIDTLRGLHHAHELTDYDGTPLKIVHRDMTPHNIFLTYDGVAKVVDFGIAKAAGRTQETRHGIIKGKIRYMAPEQAVGQDLDRRADLFALGVILWEAVTKKRMWTEKDDAAVLRDLVTGTYEPSPKAVVPEVDDRLDAICRRALALNAADRFSSAEEFANAIEDFVENRSGDARRKLGPLVAHLFEDKRAELKGVVERQLSDPSSAASRSRMPQLTDSSSTSGMLPAALSSVSSIGAIDVVIPDLPAAPLQELQKQRPFPTLLGMVAAGALVVGLGVWILVRAPVAPAAASAAVERAPDLVSVTLRATPANATFSVDDGPALQNPSIVRVPRDGKSHVIRVRAPGHKEKAQPSLFDADVVIDLSLEKDAESKPKNEKTALATPPPLPAVGAKRPVAAPQPQLGAQAPAEPHTAAAPTTSSPPPVGKAAKDLAKIDKGDPWAN